MTSAGLELDDSAVRSAHELLRHRASDDFTRFDGHLGAIDGLPDFAGGQLAVSPTELESFATFPHAYFMKRRLRVEPLEEPEEIISIPAMHGGTFIHDV